MRIPYCWLKILIIIREGIALSRHRIASFVVWFMNKFCIGNRWKVLRVWFVESFNSLFCLLYVVAFLEVRQEVLQVEAAARHQEVKVKATITTTATTFMNNYYKPWADCSIYYDGVWLVLYCGVMRPLSCVVARYVCEKRKELESESMKICVLATSLL